MAGGGQHKGSILPPLLAIGFGAALTWAASQIPAGWLRNDPGPGFLPLATGIGFVVLGLVLAWQRAPHEGMPRGGALWRVVATVLAVAIYVAVFERVGFVFATVGFLIAQFLILGVRNPLLAVGLPLATTLGIYAVFRFGLSVPLPASRLWGFRL
jgi:putative tricarboxylic transport membrane protein